MKSLLLSITLLLFVSFAAGQAVTFQGSGAHASVSTSAPGGHIILFVNQANDTSGTVKTVLTFHIETRNPDGTTTSVIGSGVVPNDAFTQQGPDKMNLNVDTSQVAGFSNTTCIFTPSPNFGFHCSTSSGGVVQIAWQLNGLNNTAGSQMMVDVIGPFNSRVQGTFDFGSADTQGSVVGFGFNLSSEAFGAFAGSGRDVVINVTQN